jgi:hypothetical protein
MQVPFKYQDTSTWKTLQDLLPAHGMLFQRWGVGQAPFAWYVRQHPQVVRVFEELWACKAEDLLTSFDGASFMMPPETWASPRNGAGFIRDDGWPHADQSLQRPDFECAQSWVTAKDVQAGDATLSVMVGSHIQHAAVRANFPDQVDGKDWVRYNPEMMAFLKERGCEEVRVTCPAGSMVLWDSRCVHYGIRPEKGRGSPKARAVVYACYTKRALANPAFLKKKQAYFKGGRTMSHNPHRGHVFSVLPRLYGKEKPKVRPATQAVLSDLGRRLAGF